MNRNAVSPVIGVIVMVAITVILAAVIAAFIFGMTGPIQYPSKETTYVVKSKFEAVGPCGFGASQEYRILTTENIVIRIADTCPSSSSQMQSYEIWYDAIPGDKITTIDGIHFNLIKTKNISYART